MNLSFHCRMFAEIQVMIRRTLLVSALVSAAIATYAQDAKKEAETAKTKMDVFASKTGVITKFTDVKLPSLKTKYEGAETRIRKVHSGNSTFFFYQITKEGKYGSSTASIEYNDLQEVLKALKELKSESTNDAAGSPDYLENNFITTDGFQVGYYVDKAKVTWYIKLEKYGSDNTLFIDNGEVVDMAFTEAKSKIDEMKK